MRTRILNSLMPYQVKVYLLPGDDKLKMSGFSRLPESDVTKVIAFAQQNKRDIIRELQRFPGLCEICPAAAMWDYFGYGHHGLVCFYTALFKGRSGWPVPCKTEATQCPLVNDHLSRIQRISDQI